MSVSVTSMMRPIDQTVFDVGAVIRSFHRDSHWLSAESDASDRHGEPTEAMMTYLLDRNINRALLPHAYGGGGLNLLDEYDLIKAGAGVCGTFGWLVFQICGNVGRVCSFYEDQVLRDFMAGGLNRAVVCYHNDPRHGIVENTQSGAILTGNWPFGSLAGVASHFALPFMMEGVEMCAVVHRGAVRTQDDWCQPALRGTCTWNYGVSQLPIGDGVLVAPVQCTNTLFLPFYIASRAAVKHAGFGVGLAREIIAAATMAAGPRSGIWHCLSEAVEKVDATMKRLVLGYQEAVLKQENGDSVAQQETQIVRANQQLHAWLLELASRAMQTCASGGSPLRARLERNLLVAASLSSHYAVRQVTPEIGHELAASPRLSALLSGSATGAKQASSAPRTDDSVGSLLV